jgi:hypothetical protein
LSWGDFEQPSFNSQHFIMAEKEATVYIVDMGKSMGERHHGRSVTDLEWAMQYVWDKITSTVCDLRRIIYRR